jgi:hypothetical protein
MKFKLKLVHIIFIIVVLYLIYGKNSNYGLPYPSVPQNIFGVTDAVYSDALQLWVAINGAEAYYSKDGNKWETTNTIPSQQWGYIDEGFVNGSSVFLTVTTDINNQYLYTLAKSTDGMNWEGTTDLPAFGLNVWSVRWNYGTSEFIAVSGGVDTWSSPDAVTWTILSPCPSVQAQILSNTDNTSPGIVVGGTAHPFIVSFLPNGSSVWQNVLTLSSPPMDARYINGSFYVVGSFGVYESQDGIHWILTTTQQAQSIEFFNGRFVLSRGNGFYYTSQLTLPWIATTSFTETTQLFTGIRAGMDNYIGIPRVIALGYATNAYTEVSSLNGKIWFV